MTFEDRIRNHMHAGPDPEVDTAVATIAATGARRSRRNKIGAGVAGAVLTVGAIAGVSQLLVDPPSSVEVAQNIEATSTTVPDTPENEDQAAAGQSGFAEEAFDGGDSDFPDAFPPGEYGGPQQVVGYNGGFAELGGSPNGIVARFSEDGVTWIEEPTSGLEDYGLEFSSIRLFADDAGFTAVIESFAFSEGAPEETLAPLVLATSPDLVNWSTAMVDVPAESDNTDIFLTAFDARDGEFVAIFGEFPVLDDPYELLLELVDAGELDPVDLENYCGSNAPPPDQPLELFSCDGEEPIAVFGPSHPRYDELTRALGEEEFGDIVIVLGSTDGVVSSVQRPDGFGFLVDVQLLNGAVVLAESPMFGDDFATESRLLLQVEGSEDWTAVRTSVENSAVRVDASGALLVVSQGPGELIVERTTNNGETWTEAAIPVDSGSESWPALEVGQAGAAVLLTSFDGSVEEAMAEQLGGPIVIEHDGVVAEFVFGESLTVTGPGGVILEIPDWLATFEAEGTGGDDPSTDFVQFEGASEEWLLLLDPVTGEEVMRIHQDEFDELAGGVSIGEETGLGFEVTNSLFFSADSGQNWDEIPLPIADGVVYNLAAVGDDEVLLVATPTNPSFDEDTFEEPELIRIPLP